MTEAADLVAQAEQVLAGHSPHRNRMACWIGRSALEAAVTTLLERRGYLPGAGSMRSRLTCLEVAYADQPDVAAEAEYAWAGLSQASHQHAFQLSPTHDETQHLLTLTRRVASR